MSERLFDVTIGFCLGGAFVAGIAMVATVTGGSSFARDYCVEHGAIAVGQYCLTEAEIILRRVPERF